MLLITMQGLHTSGKFLTHSVCSSVNRLTIKVFSFIYSLSFRRLYVYSCVCLVHLVWFGVYMCLGIMLGASLY